MGFQYFAGAAFRALTVHKDGPSLYDVCDPPAEIRRRRPPSRPVLPDRPRQPGAADLAAADWLPVLKDEKRLNELRAAIIRALRRGDAGLPCRRRRWRR
jgi:hypothetical protein